MSSWRAAVCLLAIGLSTLGRADSDSLPSQRFSRVGGSIGASYGIGALKNADLGLPARTMAAFSFEGLLGYRPTTAWTLGVDIDFRWMNQLTSVADAGGTNLRGNGWLAGFGARYRPCERWSVQAAFYFLGRYGFRQPALTGDETGLGSPLGLRIKGQYFIFRGVPLSADLDLSYVHHGSFSLAGVPAPVGTTALAAAAGLTWHFGVDGGSEVGSPAASPPVEPASVSAPEPAPAPVGETASELSKVANVSQTERGLVFKLEGDVSFEINSAELSESARAVIGKAAVVLVANPKARIKVEGHTDSQGNPVRNLTLSKARADSVRSAFIDAGVGADRVTTEGFGAKRPVAGNETTKGRAANRRVEIIVDEAASKSSEEAQ